MAKAKARAAQQVQRARPAARHVDPDRLSRLLILGGVAAVVLIALGIVGYGWYQTQIKPLGKTVLAVGDMKFSLGQLERRMRLERKSNSTYQGRTQALLQLPDVVLTQLEQEAKVLQTASKVDLSVSDDELAAAIRQRGSLADNVDPTVFANEFRRQVNDSGLHTDEYSQMLRADLLRTKLRGYFTYTGPKQEAQVLARWIVVDSQDKANQAIQRVNGGEDFAAVGQAVSLDPNSATQGTKDTDWKVRGTLPTTAVETYLFDKAQVGKVSDPIAAGSYYLVVQLLQRDDNHDLGDTQRQQVAEREMNKWLDSAGPAAHRDLSTSDTTRAINDII